MSNDALPPVLDRTASRGDKGRGEFLEFVQPLRSRQDWRRLWSEFPQVRDASYIGTVVDAVRAEGFADPLWGHVPGADVVIKPPNYRESLTYTLNSRQRALILLLAPKLLGPGARPRIYAPEAVTEFAKVLSAHSDFQGSEYLPDEAARRRFPGVMHQDVMQLSFADASFDFYISGDILEHVPDIAQTLREARRIIRPRGELLATFPFAVGSDANRVKAVLKDDGTIEHRSPPEYHGNPVDSQGSLVFAVPGWEILDCARTAGFSKAEMLAITSRVHGIVAKEVATVFVMRAAV